MKFSFVFLLLITEKVLSVTGTVPIDWFECSGRAPGRYKHTLDCTKFISCDNNGNAFEERCPSCQNISRHLCPHGRLLFNDEKKICFPAGLTKCVVAEEEDATDPPEISTTTTTSEGTTLTPTELPTTTTNEPFMPTYVPPDGLPQPGEVCNPHNCFTVGFHCQLYLRCDRNVRKWMVEKCNKGLYWNPYNPDGTDQIHGGNCDILENIQARTLQKYRDDRECCLQC